MNSSKNNSTATLNDLFKQHYGKLIEDIFQKEEAILRKMILENKAKETFTNELEELFKK